MGFIRCSFLQGELEKNFRRWKNRREIKRWEEVHQTAKGMTEYTHLLNI
ncbi:hypothetical protein LQK80_37415 [Bacillus thuringiensis]|nr:hypothetical protein [Bacillus thuringiensis]